MDDGQVTSNVCFNFSHFILFFFFSFGFSEKYGMLQSVNLV